MKLLGAIAALFVSVLVGGLLVIFTGAFNVAATDPDSAVTDWVLHTTMRHSVSARSSGIAPPTNFTDDEVRDGFQEFSEMCAGCHGAPGKLRNAVGKGLRPHPPNLAQAARDWTRADLFWIVKNGIKMTGMPAFGPTHDDPTIWNIVAFVSRLPDMTAAEYARLEHESAGSPHKHGSVE